MYNNSLDKCGRDSKDAQTMHSIVIGMRWVAQHLLIQGMISRWRQKQMQICSDRMQRIEKLPISQTFCLVVSVRTTSPTCEAAKIVIDNNSLSKNQYSHRYSTSGWLLSGNSKRGALNFVAVVAKCKLKPISTIDS